MDSIAEYFVSLGGSSRKVKLLRLNHRKTALIELDDKTVEVIFPNKFSLNQQASIRVNGKTHRIKLNKNDRSKTYNVEVDGKSFVLQLEAMRKKLSNKTSIAVDSPSSILKKEKLVFKRGGAVTSLMPGKVVLLKVKIGDKVKAGDPLCVLEAMKMENEIVAPRKGTITQVRVEQGSIVNKGDILVVIQ